MSEEAKLKRCSKCKREFPATSEYFKRRKDSPDGLRHQCKECTGGKLGVFHKRSSTVDGLRQCTNCDEWKPATVEYFYRDKTKQGGLSTRCRVCALELKMKSVYGSRYDEWKSTKNEAEALKQQGLKRCCSGSQCVTLGGPWLPASAEYFTRRRKEGDGLNPRCRSCDRYRMKQLRALRPQKYAAISRLASRRRRNDPLKHEADNKRLRLSELKRRTEKARLAHDFTVDDWQQCLGYWRYGCAACGQAEDENYCLSPDHWKPISKGGETTKYNIIPLCHTRRGSKRYGSCNHSKYNKNASEWLVWKFGEERAAEILARIEAYFEWVKQQGGS